MKHNELINIDEANEFVVGGEALKTILCIDGGGVHGQGGGLSLARQLGPMQVLPMLLEQAILQPWPKTGNLHCKAITPCLCTAG